MMSQTINSLRSSTPLFLLVALVVVVVAVSEVSGIRYFKRHFNQPQLSLDVVTPSDGKGVLPTTSTNIDDTTPDFYFPVNTGVLNFTCTIKHPLFRYQMQIVREQSFNNNQELKTTQSVISQGSYDLSESFRNADHYSLVYSEPVIDGANHIRVSFIISKIKLSDNGIYRCIYNNIAKQVNAIVYKPLNPENVIFPAMQPLPQEVGLASPESQSENVHKYTVDEEHSFVCRIDECYPKPTIEFLHSDPTNDLASLTTEKDLTYPPLLNPKEKKDEYYYVHTISSTLNYTVKYTDNNQNLSCRVNNTVNSTVVKTIRLHVVGVKTLDEFCQPNQVAQVGMSVKITCRFYANPVASVTWETRADNEIELQEAQSVAALDEHAHNAAMSNEHGAGAGDDGVDDDEGYNFGEQASAIGDQAKAFGNHVADGVNEMFNHHSEEENGSEEENVLRITEDSTNEEYSTITTDMGSNLYETVLTINNFQQKDFKAFTVRFKSAETDSSKEIRMMTESQVRNQQITNTNEASSNLRVVLSHSIQMLLSIAIMLMISSLF